MIIQPFVALTEPLKTREHVNTEYLTIRNRIIGLLLVLIGRIAQLQMVSPIANCPSSVFDMRAFNSAISASQVPINSS
jgi:hypothetical protein